jgi:hypothetical protein
METDILRSSDLELIKEVKQAAPKKDFDKLVIFFI